MASLSPPTISVPIPWPEKPANVTKRATTTATPSPAAAATTPQPTSPIAVMGLASKRPANATKQATTTATSATTPKPMSPIAVPAIELASKTLAIKSNTSNLEDDLDKLLRTDRLTEEEMKAWSLRFHGTYPPPPEPPLTAEQISEALDSC